MDLREASRTSQDAGGYNQSWERYQYGCLQRIADATELMAKNHAELIAERDRHESMATARMHRLVACRRTIAGLRGYISRLKKGKAKT